MTLVIQDWTEYQECRGHQENKVIHDTYDVFLCLSGKDIR